MTTKSRLLLLCLGCLTFINHCGWARRRKRDSYVAAVYEHAPILPDPLQLMTKEEAREVMQKNLDIYERQVRLAKNQSADIIVFPEDGLYGFGFTRDTMEPFLEDIPDPRSAPWCPCSTPSTRKATPIQYRLSCLAKNNSIYIVANAGDIKKCTREKDINCPEDGRYQFNTAIAYDFEGCLVGRYHKEKLFFEFQFDEPPKVDYSYFDAPFGRFGMYICFDIVFKDPAISLVEYYNVTDIAFPTAWMDVLPLLSAIGFHSGWARGMGVNLLASNIHKPSNRMTGSGIYTPRGVLNFVRNNSEGRLLVSTVPLNIRNMARSTPKKVDLDVKILSLGLNHQESQIFQSLLFGDVYNFVQIFPTTLGSAASVCDGRFCCHLFYETQSREMDQGNELYAFGALNKLHTKEGQYYLQNCVLLKCASGSRESCGSAVTTASWRFKQFQLSGTFETKHVFPEVIKDGVIVATVGEFAFGSNKSLAVTNVSEPILSASLFGRVYERDNLRLMATSNKAVELGPSLCSILWVWAAILWTRRYS